MTIKNHNITVFFKTLSNAVFFFFGNAHCELGAGEVPIKWVFHIHSITTSSTIQLTWDIPPPALQHVHPTGHLIWTPQPWSTTWDMFPLLFLMGSQVPQMGIHAQISDKQVMGLFNQAAEMAPRDPFSWSYINKPPGMLCSFWNGYDILINWWKDRQAYLLFIVPNMLTPMPPDRIWGLDQEKTCRLCVANGRMCNWSPPFACQVDMCVP